MIQLQGLSKEYLVDKKKVPALKHVQLTIDKGEIFGVIGHSGAGKSTLIRCINLLERPTNGKVIIDGVEMTALPKVQLQKERRSIGMIFQHFNLLASATVFDNVAFPLRLDKRKEADIKHKVDDLLRLVGLAEHSRKYPAQLSGGQKQRVGIARALANDPKVLLCDEATSALDPLTTQSILELLLDINRKLGLTIVLITHEMHVIRSICDRVAVIDQGKIVEQGQVAEVFINPRHHTTRELIAQVAEIKMDTEQIRQSIAPVTNQGERSAVIKISFVGESTYRPILSQVTQAHIVQFSILQGTISRLKDIPYGQLIVQLFGKDDHIKAVLNDLSAEGVQLEVIS